MREHCHTARYAYINTFKTVRTVYIKFTNLPSCSSSFSQEMQRLLRENDRLRKIIIRNGGSSSFSNDAAASSSRQSPAVRTAFEERIRQGRSRSPAAGAPWSTSVSVSAATTSSSSGNHGSKGIAGNRRSIRKGSKSPTTSSAAPSSDNAGSSDSSSKGKHSMSKSSAYYPPPSPGPPPPPPLLPAVEIGGTGKVLDWTTVRQSINDQHKILQLNGTPRKVQQQPAPAIHTYILFYPS